ncbi:MAG: methyltransferase domain-containing protein [Kiritimatiellia bacterium]
MNNPLPIDQRYTLERREVVVRGVPFILHRVPDLDRLLDEILAQGPESLEVKDERLPYWSEIWPSSIAMAEWLLEDPPPAAASALEIGCGPALAGIAAARSGCRVTVSDFQPRALELARHNWLANHPSAPPERLIDWRDPPLDEQYDLLIGSDVAYERRFFEALAGTFRALVRPGGAIRLTEPGRSVAQEFFPFLQSRGFTLEKHLRPVEWDGGRHSIACYRILPS